MAREVLEPGQARADVLRSPINPSDLIQVLGNYGVRPPLPAIAGNEGIGRVTEVNGEARGLSLYCCQRAWGRGAVRSLPLQERSCRCRRAMLINFL